MCPHQKGRSKVHDEGHTFLYNFLSFERFCVISQLVNKKFDTVNILENEVLMFYLPAQKFNRVF